MRYPMSSLPPTQSYSQGPKVGPEPTYHYISSGKSLLDTLFFDKKTRRPAFVMLTKQSVTSIMLVETGGLLKDIAEVRWESVKGRHVVTLDGKTMNCDEFFVKAKSLWGSGTKCFSTEGSTYKWKDSEPALHHGPHGIRIWCCTEAPSSHTFPSSPSSSSNSSSSPSTTSTSPSPSSSTSSQSSSNTPIAIFNPPQHGTLKAELLIYNGGAHILSSIILSGILAAVPKGEWRVVNSSHSRETLAEMLRAEADGRLPPYSWTHGQTHRRPGSSGNGGGSGNRNGTQSLGRRPASSGGRPTASVGPGRLSHLMGSGSPNALRRSTSTLLSVATAPPPYASRADVSTPS